LKCDSSLVQQEKVGVIVRKTCYFRIAKRGERGGLAGENFSAKIRNRE
jgi:hypothetical protein